MRSRRRFRSSARACALALSLWSAAQATAAPELRAGVFDPPRPAPDFTLSGSNGAELRLSGFAGKVVLLAFGFTSCLEVCPTTLATLASARRKLGARAGDVQVVYVTVDPERDSAARMREYLAGFDPSFLGGTGSDERLAAVRKDYGVTAERRGSGPDYAYAHSSFTYLIDRRGSLRGLMPYGHSAEDYAHDVAILLEE
jgi:protein SCO1